MKQMIAVLLALLLAASAPALAEGTPSTGGSTLPENTQVAADLDGDGLSEHISWAMVPDEYDSFLTLSVEPEGAETLIYKSEILYAGRVYIVDLNGDGELEILLTGDVMSDDYETICLHYAGGALHEVLFPDMNRGDNTGGYYTGGYGMIVEIGDNALTLEGSQDVLGTWMACRRVTLTPYERFEFCDNGLWERRLAPDMKWDDLAEYSLLKVAVPISYTGTLGSPSGTLVTGTRILIYATDKQSFAWFTTQDGVTGKLSISPDYEAGWGMQVNDVPESECFEFVPYAD